MPKPKLFFLLLLSLISAQILAKLPPTSGENRIYNTKLGLHLFLAEAGLFWKSDFQEYTYPNGEQPFGLTVNFERILKNAPIRDDKPVFSWKVPKKALEQSAYQVLVSSTKEKLALNEGDLWDSKKVSTNKSDNIDYSGTALKPVISYYWKVRIWDNGNGPSEYSVPQSFKIIADKTVYNDPGIFQITDFKPVKFEKRNNKLFLDFGKDAFATLTLNYKALKPETISITIGEQLNADGSINTKPAGSIRSHQVVLNVHPQQSVYQISLEPDRRNTKPQAAQLPESFPVLTPFRYVEISGNSQRIKRDDVVQLRYHTYFNDHASAFHSSNDILNQVWDICKYTIKATSFTGLYMDGDRERIPYEGDAYLNQLSHYTTDRAYTIAKNSIEYFMHYPTWPTEWQLNVALMMEQDYLYTGSTKLIKKYYEQLKFKTLMGLAGEDGLISTKSPKLTNEFMKNLGFKDGNRRLVDLVDWPAGPNKGERDGFVFMPYNTVINVLYVKNMEIMASFAKILDKPKEEADFNEKALIAKMAINQKMLSKTSKVYTDGIGTEHASIHANMFALAFNMVPKENIKPVIDFIKSRGMACSVYGAQYLMEALYNASEADYALSLMTSTSQRSWYNMIRVGSTMTMEAWDMKYKPNSDWNHPWGAAPANVIPRLMWGIQPKTPGGSIIAIKPQLSTLTHTEIKVPFLNGEVYATYKKVDKNKQIYSFDIPANMLADVKFTYMPNQTLRVNGKIADIKPDSIRLEPGISLIELINNNF